VLRSRSDHLLFAGHIYLVPSVTSLWRLRLRFAPRRLRVHLSHLQKYWSCRNPSDQRHTSSSIWSDSCCLLGLEYVQATLQSTAKVRRSLCVNDGSLVFLRRKKLLPLRKGKVSYAEDALSAVGLECATLQSLGCSTLQCRRRLELGESEALQDNCRKSVSIYLTKFTKTNGEALSRCDLLSNAVSDPTCSRV
jgi:hypothetical protein